MLPFCEMSGSLSGPLKFLPRLTQSESITRLSTTQDLLYCRDKQVTDSGIHVLSLPTGPLCEVEKNITLLDQTVQIVWSANTTQDTDSAIGRCCATNRPQRAPITRTTGLIQSPFRDSCDITFPAILTSVINCTPLTLFPERSPPIKEILRVRL